ncbi:MAG TPA: pantoate--beta-alanine ligase [Bryobacteraceae bacterium]|nr:pantoate--beta-alanine ligase [Bryobacteraceae bacterium]
MRVWNTVEQWRERRRALAGKSIGVVPTMGALHKGHAALVERCRAENEIAMVTIFVNPAQFNDPNDLRRYPRTMEADLALLEGLGVDDVLAPAASEMYPAGYRFRVTENEAAGVMEGLHRPGFFEGVMTVVLKLLNLARADRAYFGEKDYQQLHVVSNMARDFFTGTEIVPCPTVREPSGLAASSRNALLSPGALEKAPLLYRALTTAATVGEAKAALEAEGFRVEYVEEHWGRRFVAAFLDGVRLIDNVPRGEGKEH